ncbi:response regulator [Erythrobacteraceae bacterium WH01K]|nr:response regulator [Erythrobacteraceae bacterium WH01K]
MAHILIVDDDELIAEMASEILITKGHACGWVTSGEEALDLLKWRRPDLMLLDQGMPGMSGAKVLREVRGSKNLYDLPVIMFTAMTGAGDEEQARYNGAQDYIRKPFDPKFMLLKVKQVLAARAESPKHLELEKFLARSNNIAWEEDAPPVQRYC